MMIELVHGSTRAVINPVGAWVEDLTAGNAPLFFPKAELTNEAGEVKIRGGMHVCLPNFGPGGDSGLAQHGFGRTSTWRILQQNESEVVLNLEANEAGYEGLVATLTYHLDDTSLAAQLELTNHSNGSLRAAPGFHPYFALDGSETAVKVNETTYKLADLAGTEFIETDHVELVTTNRTLHLAASNLTTWAIWTDQLGNYICVEPTLGGYRFLEAEQPDETLKPHESRTYSLTISW